MVESVKCTGCSACFAICPKHCIDMQESDDGFLYPQINKDECINCGLCERVCPIEKESIMPYEQKYYVSYNKDKVRHEKSSSGGMFIEFSDWILNQGGVVIGAAFDDQFNLKHMAATDILLRDKMLGSKYLQSDLRACFEEIYNALVKSQRVLFSGTACQIAGVKEYLKCKKQSDELLYTIEIICHGVASPGFFADFLKRDADGKQLESISFTNKSKKNEIKGFYRKYSDGAEKYTRFYDTSYGKFFLKNYTLRESCYECRYSKYDRKISDIVIGDLWGKNIQTCELKNELGVSVLIVNSSKGADLFQHVCNKFYFKKCEVQDILQPNLLNASEKPQRRDRFWQDYKKYDYKFFEKKWEFIVLLEKIRKKIFS